MKTIQYKVAKKPSTSLPANSLGKEAIAPVLSKAYKARAELMATLRKVRPTLAARIEKSDDVDHEELNRRVERLTRELVFLNRDCDRLLVDYDASLRPSSGANNKVTDMGPPEAYRWPNSDCNGPVTHTHVEEALAKAMNRRTEIASELQQIKELRDAPLFVRLHAASDLIKTGLDQYAAEVLLDLISSGFYGLELLMSGDNDTVEFCLRRISSLHGTGWLDRLIHSQPPAVANYMRLRELMKDSIC